mmetsp:Transcript_20205/g.61612  ORF Transcript_20205/g.61612 Transcript_20205/m.61612 type:complete len:515 (-) Transcript_20205:152-1696(-)
MTAALLAYIVRPNPTMSRTVLLLLLLARARGALVPPPRVVMKFGGSSVRDAERIAEVASLVRAQMVEHSVQPCLVCSAMGKTTNGLLAAADRAIDEGTVDLSTVRALHVETLDALSISGTEASEVVELLDKCERTLEGVALLGELSPRTRDLVVSYGERLSGRVVAATLRRQGVRAKQLEAWDVGVVTTDEFGEATPLDQSWEGIAASLLPVMEEGTVPVVTGFIGKDLQGRVTTLGRGGSDLTASLLGAAAGFDEVQVWKDVDGILTADPRICPAAAPVARVTFDEAAELAYFGAQVLHPLAMQPCRRAGVPFRVKNSYNPAAEGTLISADGSACSETRLVSAITSKNGVQLVDIESTRMLGAYGFLARVFAAFDRWRISIDVIASSEVSVSLTLNKNQLLERRSISALEQSPGVERSEALVGLMADLEQVANVRVSGGHSIVTLIANVGCSSAVVSAVCAAMDRLGIPVQMISQGASKVNISIVVPEERAVEAVQELHRHFFEQPPDCAGAS